MTNRLTRNTGLLIFSNVGSAAFSLLLTVIIARAYGDQGLGIYALAAAWIHPISLIAEFGIGTLLTRDLAREPDSAPMLLSAAIRARLLIGGAAFALVLLGAPFISNDARVIAAVRISAPMILILPFFSTFTAVFRARQRMQSIPFLNIGMIALQVIMTLFVVWIGGGLVGVLVANVLSSAVQLAAAYGVYRRGFMVKLSAHGESVPRLMRRAWHFACAAVFIAVQIRLSAILLEAFASASAVGQYTAASRFIEAARLIPNAFFGAFLPTLAALSLDPARLALTFRRAMIGLGVFGLIGAFLLTFSAPLLIALLFGDEFGGAVIPLQVLAWSLVGGLLRGGQTLYWYAQGRERAVNLINAAVIPVQIALSLWLIPAYGAVGAAWVQVIVELGAFAALWRPPSKQASPEGSPLYEAR